MQYICSNCEYLKNEILNHDDEYICPLCGGNMKELKQEKIDEKLNAMIYCIKSYDKNKIWDEIEKQKKWQLRIEQRQYYFKALKIMGLTFK